MVAVVRTSHKKYYINNSLSHKDKTVFLCWSEENEPRSLEACVNKLLCILQGDCLLLTIYLTHQHL